MFFGGGTPSLMPPDLVGAVIERIDQHWQLATDAEITLEANPSSSDAAQFTGYRAGGVNRLSIGVQSLRNRDLAALGRLHTAEEARAAVVLASEIFPRVSLDLIYGRQNQSLEDWEAELREALQWGSDHLSLYQLTIEEGTAFGERLKSGRLDGLPDGDLAAEMQLKAIEICGDSGYHQYEISNYSRPGGESRHNLIYWRCHDYLGIGPGAHGRISVADRRAATETHLSPSQWLSRVMRTGSGESCRRWLSASEQAEEYLMMSLRLAEGVDLARYSGLNGQELCAERIAELERQGLLRRTADRLNATAGGSLVLNSVLSTLLH